MVPAAGFWLHALECAAHRTHARTGPQRRTPSDLRPPRRAAQPKVPSSFVSRVGGARPPRRALPPDGTPPPEGRPVPAPYASAILHSDYTFCRLSSRALHTHKNRLPITLCAATFATSLLPPPLPPLPPPCPVAQVMEAAAANLTPVVLELGGKDAFIVCDDANLNQVGAGSLPQERSIAVR